MAINLWLSKQALKPISPTTPVPNESLILTELFQKWAQPPVFFQNSQMNLVLSYPNKVGNHCSKVCVLFGTESYMDRCTVEDRAEI